MGPKPYSMASLKTPVAKERILLLKKKQKDSFFSLCCQRRKETKEKAKNVLSSGAGCGIL